MIVERSIEKYFEKKGLRKSKSVDIYKLLSFLSNGKLYLKIISYDLNWSTQNDGGGVYNTPILHFKVPSNNSL